MSIREYSFLSFFFQIFSFVSYSQDVIVENELKRRVSINNLAKLLIHKKW